MDTSVGRWAIYRRDGFRWRINVEPESPENWLASEITAEKPKTVRLNPNQPLLKKDELVATFATQDEAEAFINSAVRLWEEHSAAELATVKKQLRELQGRKSDLQHERRAALQALIEKARGGTCEQA